MRVLAARVLSQVIKDGKSLTAALESVCVSIDKSQDKAFVQALCYGVMRQYHQLDFILQQLLAKPLKQKQTDIKVLLLMGLYQLSFMRVKPHAAVSETVSAVNKKPWAKSLVNGVLRQYLRERESIDKKVSQNSSAIDSHPQWIINKIYADWPTHANHLLQQNNQQAPMVLRVNLAQMTAQDYLQLLTKASIEATLVDFCPSAIVLAQPIAVEKLPRFHQGFVSVQDTAAQLAALLLDAQAGQSVLDLCAAPGGKTAAILEQQTQLSSLLAIDIDEGRLAKIKDNLQRLQLPATVLVGDATQPDEWAQGQTFDRILIDAPCSAFGVIRRHPDIKLLRRESDLDALQSLQQQILNAAWKLLKPNGILLYATCSVLKQENEQQIALFLDHHADASEILIDAKWGIKRKFGRQIMTGELGMDGFYYAKLVKL